MRGIRIDYGGVAIGAKENFVPTTLDKEDFVDLAELQQEGLSFPNYGNPCELYSVLLNGNAEPFPDDTEPVNLGWWSEQISGADGVFAEPIILTLTSPHYYTSSGITLTFDTYNGIFANDLTIAWYKDDAQIGDTETFSPDSAFYFCQKKVVDYNKVIITFKGINMPYNRLKLRSIEYGMRVTFYGDELRNCKIIQEIDPISSQIAINTCDFTLDSKRNIEYAFQERQPVSVYFNDMLRSTSFVKSAKRKSKNVWDIKTEDYIGLLESTVFYGGLYSGKSSYDLITEILSKAGIPFYIADDVPNQGLDGYIPYTNCREALMQAVFAIGAVVDTTNADKVNIYMLSDNSPKYIELGRIMQGQNFDDETNITAVEVVSHEYIESEETVTAYDANQSGIGDNIFVKFSQPLHDLKVENGSITSKGANFAIIDAREGCKLIGNKYEDRQILHRRQKESVNEYIAENIVSVQNATLVSAFNVNKVLANVFNYYASNLSVNLKIVEGNNAVKYGSGKYGEIVYQKDDSSASTKVGDAITCETEYLGDITGRILKQTYNLIGGIIIKDTKMKKLKIEQGG